MSLSTKARKKNKKKAPLQALPPHDHSSELKRLSRIKGQIEGVERMILEKRYCPEIVNQIKAARSALRSLEVNVIGGHLRHCVKEAIKSHDPLVVQEKIEEIVLFMKGQDL